MSALHWTNVAVLPLLAGGLLAMLTASVWRHRHRPVGFAFLVFLAATMVWSFGYAAELCSPTLEGALFWAAVQYVGIPVAPAAVLAFVLLLAGARSRNRWLWAALAVPSVVTWFAAWTDSRLHLLRHGVRFSEYDGYSAVVFLPGPAYLANIAVSYAFLAISLGVLIRLARGRNQISRRHARVVLLGMILPVVGNVLRLFGFEVIPGVDQTPALFALSAVAAAYGVFRYSLFSVAPIARDKVVDDLADGVIVLDAQGHVVDANPAAARILGFSVDELARADSKQLTRALPYESMSASCDKVVEIGDRAYYLRCVAVAGSDLDTLGTILQLTDVTVQHRAEEALRRAKEAAEEASATKSRFVANISHELRTPLNGVIGLSDLLAKTPLEPGQREYLTGIRHCSDTLLALINDVLDLSKIEADAMTLLDEPVDVAALVEEIVSVHRSLAARKGLQVKAEVRGLPPRIIGDNLRLRQILNNLIGNAVKFTEEGQVLVTAQPSAQDRYEIVVTDTGIGIPLDKQTAVFEAFQQADASTTREYGGTGLGLPITARLVRGMDGALTLKSHPGQGTEMRVSLPLRAALVAASPEASVEKLRQGLRVLVAEDNEVNALVVLSMLEDLSCVVEHACDGVEAIEALELRDFDVLLLDIQMPRMDGLEVSRTVRARWPDRPLKIFALTANALEGERRRAMEAGMDGFLTKPIRQEEIVAALQAPVSR
jgi:signal transduction histidine kinase